MADSADTPEPSSEPSATAHGVGETRAVLREVVTQVTHDLRNPLTVISGYTQMLLHSDDPEKMRARCQHLLEQIDVLTQLMSDLTTFVHAEGALQRVAVPASELGSMLRRHLERQATPRNIEVTVETDSSDVMLDVQRVRRVLFNLCRHAMDDMPRGGQMTVRLDEHQAGLKAVIAYDGEGAVPPETDPWSTEALERFWHNGRALRQAMAHQFMVDHHGVLTLRRDPPYAMTLVLPPVADPAGDTT